MILDPRLVPWSDVAPGIAASALVAALAGWSITWWSGWFFRIISVSVLTAAPIIGWAWMIHNLSGGLPSLPPADAPLWALYFSAAGATLAISSSWWVNGRYMRSAVAAAAVLGLLAALWFLLVGALHESIAGDLPSGGMVTFALSALAIYLAMTLWSKDAQVSVAAGFSPWITGLVMAAICLTLTGTARVGILALGLALASIPAALGFACIPRHFTDTSKNDNSPRGERFGLFTFPWAPQAFALPPLVISGPLFASTSWHVANLILSGVIAGIIGIYAWDNILRRNPHYASMGITFRTLAAIGIGMAATAAPVIIPIKNLLTAAARTGFPY